MLSPPVSTRGVSKLGDRLDSCAGHEVATFDRDFSLDVLLTLDHADCGEFLPVLSHGLVHPRDVRDQGGAAGFDPAMIFFDLDALLHGDIPEIKDLGVVKELNDRLRQVFLIVFDRQHVVATLVDDCLGNVRLTSQGVGSDDTSLE